MPKARPEILTLNEAADVLRKSPRTLRQWRWQGNKTGEQYGPPALVINGRVHYRLDVLEAWLAEHDEAASA